MHTESSIAFKNHTEKRNSLSEICNVERQLWMFVQSRGLSNADVQNLYRKACQLYEKIFLGNNELEELQEAEYSLWKLHYKQIDEFRKRTSLSHGPSRNPESIQEGFKLFLKESSRFYQDLISKLKRYYGFWDTTLFYYNHTDGISSSVDHAKLHKCRLVCHRLLVRLGDLARYSEVNQNPGKRNWSAVAQCYFEAAKMYPDGGNPQNQLALLATPPYIGDEFLALYHCVRSIAVKEPFPDASDNLHFIFERNMSVHIPFLSVGSEFNFLKPSERVTTSVQAQAGNGDADLWSIFVRLTSFFFLELSLESFSCTFASTLRELEALLALDDAKLTIALESYQNLNIAKPGPYRALQLVSVFIFTVHNLSENIELQSLKKLHMALTVTCICMGRIVERCLKGVSTDDLPLLPTIMLFSEWLVEVLQRIEKYEVDENLSSAISYLFSSYAELLNQLLECKNQVESPNRVALWEDFEMRGFIPVSQSHSCLDFSSHSENEANFRAKNEYRVCRIIEAALKIANRPSDGNRSWIFFEKAGKLCAKEFLQKKETQGMKEVAEEEEDIIVFKPIDRYNSAPLSQSTWQEGKNGPEQPAVDESLRRASSLLIAQNRALISSLTSNTGFSRTHLSTIPETPSSGRVSPPSLSSWVLNDKPKGNIMKTTPTETLTNLCTSSPNERFCFNGSASTSNYNYFYCPPTPSAPLIPEDAAWSKPSSYVEPPLPPWPRTLHFTQKFPIPAVYTESTVSMNPSSSSSSSFVAGLYDQRKDKNARFHRVGEDQQQLLQYLKEKEWRIQQEAHIADYANTRN